MKIVKSNSCSNCEAGSIQQSKLVDNVKPLSFKQYQSLGVTSYNLNGFEKIH